MDQISASQKTKALVREKLLLGLICLFGLLGAFAVYMTYLSSLNEFEKEPATITPQVKEVFQNTGD